MVNAIKSTQTGIQLQSVPRPSSRFNKRSERRLTSFTLLFMVLLMMPLWVFAQSLTVSSDRQTIEMGDIITLYIKADFQTRGSQLDLDSLNDQFEVLGRQQSNQISIINGSFTSNTQWQVTLLAKQEGELIVPPLRINGVESLPYKIKVLPAQQKSANQLGDYFLESSLNKQQAYIQEEVLYSFRLYFLGEFQGNIRPPQFENSLSTTLKDQSVFGKQINGRQYTVYEWLYSIYPQQSGELTITGPLFSGIHRYRNRQKGVQEMAESQVLNVLPEPVSFKQQANNTWLPAKAVELSQTWQSLPNTLRVGDSLTRTLSLDVLGLSTSQLPTLSTENQAEFKVYADQPISEETILSDGLRSQLQLKQTIIPTQAGQITLPEQTIHWWNTETNKMQIARIAAQELTILPVLNTGANPSSNPAPALFSNNEGLQNLPPTPQESNEKVSRETSLVWPIFTALLALIWFITLWLWRRQNKQLKARLLTLEQTKSDKAESEAALLETKQTFCTENTDLSPKDFYHQLRQELNQKYGIQSFSDLQDDPLKQAINDLEKHLFHQTELPEETLNNICKGLQKLSAIPDKKTASTASKLASLYKA